MTKAEKLKVNRLKSVYPDFCKGKCERTLLTYAQFIEAVRREMEAQEREFDLKRKFSIAAAEEVENELISGMS